MQINIQPSDDSTTIAVQGDIEITTIKEFKEAVYEVGKNIDKDVIVDFSGVNYLDSSGIGILLTLYKMQKNRNKEMSLVNCSDNIKKIIELSSLRDILKQT